MNGIGTDIYGTSDQGRFVYKQLTGDGTIVARVDRLDSTTHVWAKAGVMIRGSLDPISSWAYILYGGENGVRFQARLSQGASATSDTELGPPADLHEFHSLHWIGRDQSCGQCRYAGRVLRCHHLQQCDRLVGIGVAGPRAARRQPAGQALPDA